MWMPDSNERPANRPRKPGRSRRTLVGLATLTTLLNPGCTSEQPAADPPLAPLWSAEPAALNPQAEETELRLLAEFERTGQIPVDDELSPRGLSGEEALGDDILGEIVPGPEDEPPEAEVHSEVGTKDIDVNLTTPEALGAEVFHAMVHRDIERFNRILIDADALQDLAKIKSDTAHKRAALLMKSARQRYDLFAPRVSSEAHEGGLANRLVYVRTRIGKGATVWGKTPRRGEQIVQYWNNATVFRVRRPEEPTDPIAPTSEPDDGTRGPYFEIDLGRMLKTPKGEWRLASAPSLSGSFHVFLQAGLHLKPEMLHPEHHELPLSIGDFWRYRVLRSDQDTNDAVLDVSPEEIRFEVIGLDKYPGYRIATMRRTHSTDKRSTSTQHLLVTARRAYQCTRYCKYKGADLGYILDYIRINTPLLSFPAQPGDAWRNGGHKPTMTAPAKHTIRDNPEQISVPAGEFSRTLAVEGKREIRWFKPGVGIVKRQTRSKHGTRTQELIEYRVLTTE